MICADFSTEANEGHQRPENVAVLNDKVVPVFPASATAYLS
jgi:hypothetical protein